VLVANQSAITIFHPNQLTVLTYEAVKLLIEITLLTFKFVNLTSLPQNFAGAKF
jgi:hypothetical protein